VDHDTTFRFDIKPHILPTSDNDKNKQYFHCPALNCSRSLEKDDILEHLQSVHSVVISDQPECHSNSIEITNEEMILKQEAAAWAPTLLTAFGQQFFFETWRDDTGNWSLFITRMVTKRLWSSPTGIVAV
jgi:hypothetical protein